MDFVKFLMWAAWAVARRKLSPTLLGSFNVALLEFVSKESTDLVLKKDSFRLKLESRVEETLPSIIGGLWQGTAFLFLYATFFGGPFTNT